MRLLKYLVLPLLLLSACSYSFTGGNVPVHLKTLFIEQVEDNSGYGDPLYRNLLNEELVDAFRRDNSLNVVDQKGDATLSAEITGIRDQTVAVGAGQLETERRITISVKAKYYDNVKNIQIFDEPFSKSMNYEIENAQENRDQAILDLLDQISDDIMLKVVSGW